MVGRKRKARPVVYKGEKHDLADLCKAHGKNLKTVERRIKSGWEVERAIDSPTVQNPGALSHHQSSLKGKQGKIGPARTLKNTFAKTLLKALEGLGEAEQIEIIQREFKNDPIRFMKDVILPLVPKDELDKAEHHTNGEKAVININNAYMPKSARLEEI